jgi:hypothetical protein
MEVEFLGTVCSLYQKHELAKSHSQRAEETQSNVALC